MKILQFQDNHIREIVQLWNKLCESEMPYKTFTDESFRNKFIKNPNFSYEGTFVAVEDNRIIGFANGVIKKELLPNETHENTPGYLTIVMVDKEYRNRGYGTQLLKAVENYFRDNGKNYSDVIFFNPINLEWYIPGTNKHDHNNAPGVDIEGPGYEFLKRNGYKERSRELSFHLDLKDFKLSSNTINKIDELSKKDIYVGYYDEAKHFGFDELFDDLGSEDWRKGIKDNLALKNPYPTIVASHNGKICGFTGPIKVQESGRGWFIGIGTHSQYRGMGIMTVMFDLLLDGFKKAGAKFSTLFTNVNNPARKTYERTGYTVVKTWAVMRKEGL